MKIKLNYNENSLVENEIVKKLLSHEFSYANFYPEMLSAELKNAIAKKFSLIADDIVIGNGIDELVFWLCVLAKENGDFVTTENTYKVIDLAADALNRKCHNLRIENFHIDINSTIFQIEQILKSRKIGLLYLCNPHNPFGTCFNGDFSILTEFCERKNILLLIDEAYGEYAENFTSAISFYEKYKNVIVLKTFSKAYGLAGLRCGYLITKNEKIISSLEKYNLMQPAHINSLAQSAVIETLKNDSFIEEVKQKNKENKAYFCSQLDELKLEYLRSETNFIILKTNFDNTKFCEFLAEKGVLIRNCDDFGLKEYIRITISKKEYLDNFINLLKLFIL